MEAPGCAERHKSVIQRLTDFISNPESETSLGLEEGSGIQCYGGGCENSLQMVPEVLHFKGEGEEGE